MSFWWRRWAEQSRVPRYPHHVAVGVGEDLNLHVAGLREVALHVALIATEVRSRLRASRSRASRRLTSSAEATTFMPSPASAVCGLDRRPASRARRRKRRISLAIGGEARWCRARSVRRRVFERPCGSRPCRTSRPSPPAAGTDELDAHSGDRAREVGVLAEEPVARMHRVGSAVADRGEHGVGVDDSSRRPSDHPARTPRRRAGRGARRGRVRSRPPPWRCPSHGGADHAHRDLASVGNQDLLQHG